MNSIKTSFFLALNLLLFGLVLSAQKMDVLPRSIPEAEGISSKGIINFIDAANKSKHEFHSFMFLRHGKVVAEGWWNPYQPDLRHTMYSISKSFTSTAVGFAVREKRLSVNDKVISFFPEDLPDSLSPNLSEMTVKDLLTMTAGQEPDPTFTTVTRDSNWVKTFLSTPVRHKPGTVFLYNTLATYMLSAIVQKVTGEKVLDYLQPRLFKPLAINGADWEISPQNISTGGWGLRVKTEDMAKLGQLYLQKGKWKETQVLSKEWIEEATTKKIQQLPATAGGANADSSDWLQGYCYQFWRCRNNAYRADGAFGQFIIMMPEQDAVVVITSEAPDMQDEINLVWKYLLPAIHAKKLPADPKNTASLQQKLSSLALSRPGKPTPSPAAQRISGKSFAMAPNEKHIDQISFQLRNNTYEITLASDTARYKLSFGSRKWVRGETNKRGPYLLATAKANHVGLFPLKVAGSYGWKDENTLELVLRYIESPHSEKMTCHFDNDQITLDMHSSTDPDNVSTTLKGESPHQ